MTRYEYLNDQNVISIIILYIINNFAIFFF